ncbi:unnamed protein product, partial [Staurois parvus]
ITLFATRPETRKQLKKCKNCLKQINIIYFHIYLLRLAA